MSDQILLTEAAKLVGKAPATLRRLINDGRIQSTKDSQGRNRVRREDRLGRHAVLHGRGMGSRMLRLKPRKEQDRTTVTTAAMLRKREVADFEWAVR